MYCNPANTSLQRVRWIVLDRAKAMYDLGVLLIASRKILSPFHAQTNTDKKLEYFTVFVFLTL